MKGILKTGLLLLSAMFIGTGSVYAYELSPEEQQLADYFAMRCNTAPQLIQWPVGFEHPVDKFACDITAYLGKPYSVRNRYLFQAAQHFKRMDASFIHQKVNSDYYGESLWKKFITTPFNQTAVDQAIHGNPQAFEFIARWPEKIQLTKDQKAQFRLNYPSELLRVFEQAGDPNNPPIDYLIIWGAANIHLLSPNLLRAVKDRIFREISFQRPNRADIAHYILAKPFQIRAALLSLWTLTTYDSRNDELLDFLQMINWTGPSLKASTDVFNREISWSLGDLSHPYIYFAYMRQLEDISLGVPIAIRPSLAIGNVLLIREYGWASQFDQYFPRASQLLTNFELTADKKALKQDFRDLEKWLGFEDINLQNFAIQELLTYPKGFRDHLRSNSMFKDVPISKLESLQNQSRVIAERSDSIFRHLFVEQVFYFSDHEQKDRPKYFEDVVLQKQDRIIAACEVSDPDNENCFRSWTSFPGTYLPLVVGGCVLNRSVKEAFLVKLFRNGVIPTPMINQCSLSTIEDLSKGTIQLPRDLAFTHGFPLANGGVRWASSLDAVVDSGMPLVSIHWLSVANTENFPIADDDSLIALWFSRDGLSFLRRHARAATVSTKKYELGSKALGYFDSYRASQQLLGRYAEAFQTSLKKIDHESGYFPYLPWREFSELFYSGVNLGIPKEYLAEYVKQHVAYQLPNYEGGVEGDQQIEFYEGFLSNASVNEISTQLSGVAKNPKSLYWVIGAVFALGPAEKLAICANSAFEKAFKSGDMNWALLDAAGTFARFERGNLDSICRGQVVVKGIFDTYRNNSDSVVGLNDKVRQLGLESYQRMLSESFNPYILGHQNFIHPRWLDSLFIFSAMGGIAEREFGVLFSLLALKSIYLELMTSFVNTDGVGLRSELKKLEETLATLGHAIQRLAPTLDKKSWNDLWTLHTSLMIVARNPLLNDRVRDRLVMFDAQDEVVKQQVTDEVNRLASEFKKIRLNSAKATSVIEFVENKVSRQNSIDVSFQPFKASDAFWSIDPKNWARQGISFISLASNGSSIQTLALSADGELKTGNSSINMNELALESVKKEIRETNRISAETQNSLCSALVQVHQFLLPSIDGAKSIHFVPSINLLPIPPEILLGPSCNGHKIPPIYLVNDILASMELSETTDLSLPTNLIAAANPMVQQNSLLDFSNFRSANLHRSGPPDFDLGSLAPLPDAEIEVATVAPQFKKSTLFLGPQGDIRKALSLVGQEEGPSMLVLATHGFAASESASEALPGLLSIKDGTPEVVTSLDIYDYDLTDSIVLLSACSTASGFVDKSEHMFTGFVKSVADAGAKVIVSSLWPVNSVASRRLTENFVEAWKRTGDLNQGVMAGKTMKEQELSWPFVFIYP